MTSSITDFKGKIAIRCHDSWQSVSRLLCNILQFRQCCGHNPTRAVRPQSRCRTKIKRVGQARFTGERGSHSQARLAAQSDYFRLAHDPGAIRR